MKVIKSYKEASYFKALHQNRGLQLLCELKGQTAKEIKSIFYWSENKNSVSL